jgi:PAS domain S-box-containing protein
MSAADPKLPLFEDADETVAAIHQGEVDAVVVMRALEGPQVILLQGAEEPYRVLVERMSDGALTADRDGVILYVNDRLCEQTGYPSAGLVGRSLPSLFEGEPPNLVPEVTVEASLLRGGESNARFTFLLSAGPLTDRHQTVGSIVTLTDITERERAEEAQTTLVAELNHRVKNILAVVQSVASQTVRSSVSLENFADAFAGRIKALATAHDILTETRWIGIGLGELLAAVLAPAAQGFAAPAGSRKSVGRAG